MYKWFLFIHLASAVSMGFYVLLPFLAGRLARLNGASLEGYSAVLQGLNRIAQPLLVVQLLTGGYLMSKGSFSGGWMAAAIVLLLAIGALGGIIGVNLKRLQKGATDESGAAVAAAAGKVRTLGWILAVCYLLVLGIMENPSLLG